MKTWEEAEFDAQQEAILKWAKKRYVRMISGWWLNRRLNKIQRLAEIITGRSNLVAYIGLLEVKEKEDQKCMK